MIEIYEKRGRWCYTDTFGKVHKFSTEAEAKAALGWKDPVEEDCCEGEEDCCEGEEDE